MRVVRRLLAGLRTLLKPEKKVRARMKQLTPYRIDTLQDRRLKVDLYLCCLLIMPYLMHSILKIYVEKLFALPLCDLNAIQSKKLNSSLVESFGSLVSYDVVW